MNEKLNILVVEDKEENILAAQHNLSMYAVTSARTFYEAKTLLEKSRNHYDVVLSDMFFSYGSESACRKESHHESPLGYATVLYAARVGVPLIGIVTDCNHHSNSIAASFDAFYVFQEERGIRASERYRKRPIINVNNSLLVMFDEEDLPADDDKPYCDLHMIDFTPITSERAHMILDLAVGRSKELIKKIKPWRTALEVMLTLRQ